jgi:transposase-like protein
MENVVYRYSEAFKMQVVRDLDAGRLRSISEAKEKYGITGNVTIHGWLKKYGRGDLLPRKVRIEMPDEKDQIKKLNKRIRELEKALADSHVHQVIDQARFEVLCEQMGITDIEGYKKKISKKLFNEGDE